MKVLLAALVAVVTQGGTPDPLVGLWESDARSNGGIGAAVELKSDGTYTQAMTVLVDGYYRVVGDRLFITEKPSTDEADARAGGVLSFKDGKCLVTGPDGSVITKERVGQAQEGAPPIVGVWRYQHPGGATAFERYTPDGRISLRLPLGSQSGKFTVDADTLKLTPDGGAEVQMKVKVENDGLTMTDAASKATQWHRVIEGAWYQLRK